MTHKERGLAPFKNASMDRFPMWYGGAPEIAEGLKKYTNAKSEDETLYEIIGIDYKTIRPKYIGGPEHKKYDDGSFDTEWGKRSGLHWGQAIDHPLAGVEDIQSIINFDWPPVDWFDCKFTEADLKWLEGYCVIGGCWSPFFHNSMELVGMEDFFVQLMLNGDIAMKTIEKCFEFYYELDKRSFELNPNIIDMYFIGNDFGSKKGLLVNPDIWRKYYKPFVKELMAQAKKYGCVTALHSCGDIHEIIRDLIEIGVDAINPIQVSAANMVPEDLIREYGRDVIFFGGVDENEILQYGSEETIRQETRRIIDTLGKHNRYILAASHDYLLPEIPASAIYTMYDEGKKYGVHKL